MARILIDGRFIGVGESMTRYCMEIVRGILELDHENEYTLLVRPQATGKLKEYFDDELRMTKPEQNPNSLNPKNGSFVRYSTFGFRNLSVDILDIPHYSLAEQTKLLAYLNEQKYDLVHFIQFNHPIRYRGKFVVSIHDLTLIGHLHREKFHKRLAFGQVMKSAAKNSTKIITISETSKKEIVDYYNVPADKIAVTYLAADASANSKADVQAIRAFKNKHQISGDYLLYTGMWKRHKNILRMIAAFKKFKMETDSRVQLVLVGKIDPKEPEVTKLINEINERIMNNELRIKEQKKHNSSFIIRNSDRLKPIITTGFVEDSELSVAYAGALVYVIPSLSEGFGLPPLEAMGYGTPVISSNVSAMPEVLGDAALYFDPYNVNDMARAMTEITTDSELRSKLSKKGLAQAAKYSWSDTAKKTLEVYNEVLKS